MPDLKTEYLYRAIDPVLLKKQIQIICKRLRKYQDDFDAIAIRGMSGALVGSSVAMKMGKGICLVRKKDGSHSIMDVEGDKDHKRYIIIDDLIANGDTIKTIIYNMDQFNQGKLIGIFLYNQDDINFPTMKTYADNFKCWIKSTGDDNYTCIPKTLE